ncbi:glycine N-acyltransferase-like protein 3 isoform X2 [Struthio camelus]
MTVARGNPAGHEVLVDSWPHFGVVLSRRRPQEPADPGDIYANQVAVHYRDAGAWRALLGGTAALDWSGGLQLHGMQEGLHEAVREVAAAKGLLLRTYRFQALLSPGPPRAWVPVPPGLRLAPVPLAHVPLLNATWGFGGNVRSGRFLASLVQAFPSACLLDRRGRPVSWSLVDPLGCLSHGYTVPVWRGRGLSGLTLATLGRVLHAQGYPVYCGVLPDNTPSQRAVRAVGFLPQPGTLYMLVVTPGAPPAPQQ